MKSALRIGLILGLLVVFGHLPTAVSPVTNDLQFELNDDQFLSKIAANMADGKTCEHFAEHSQTDVHEEQAKVEGSGKQITVSSLVQRALSDQRELLEARQNDLERWGPNDQKHFAKWFGTTSDDARELIQKRIQVLMLLNDEYSVGNFRKAVPSRRGVFAFVRAKDPSKIFVDLEFIRTSFLGESSRAGVLCHEMSHFTLAGGTKDIIYGSTNCRRLARLSSVHALSNADNFEFYVEGVR